MKNRPELRVSCEMIIEKNGKVLMGRRGKAFGEGSWAFPGGHLEVNERTNDCARRELAEETGINVQKMRLLGIINDIPDLAGQDNHYIRFVYLITKYSGEIENKEPDKCDGWVWFKKSELPKPIFVGHKKVIKFFMKRNDKLFIE